MPALAASLAPMNLGSTSGTNSSMCVARSSRPFTKQYKSSSCALTESVIRILSFASTSAACSSENCPLPPGIPGVRFRRSPSMLSQVFLPTLVCCASVDSVVRARSVRWLGTFSILLKPSRSQPRARLIVFILASPFFSLLIAFGSFLVGGSSASFLRNTRSRLWKSVRRWFVAGFCGSSCAVPQKSSTNTSICASGRFRYFLLLGSVG